MTEDVNWAQKLVDKHGWKMLNYIRVLHLTEDSKTILEIELKELIANVASDVLNTSKDIFFKVLDKKIVEAKTK